MKKLTLLGSCAFCFLLGTLVPLGITRAQPLPSKTTYYNLSFMKTFPGQDAFALEKKWKAVQMDLVKTGAIKSWSVLQPVYSGPHNYDYMTLIAFDDFDAYNKIEYLPLFKKNWGEDKWQSVLKETNTTHEMIGNEVWSVVTSTGQ